MKIQIINVKAILPDSVLENAVIAYEDEKIVYVGTQRQEKVEETLDGSGAYLFSGFIDLHCHGGAGLDFMDASAEEMRQIAKYHLSQGTTTLIATTMTDTWEAIEKSLQEYEKLYKTDNTLTLNGVHLEGPWLSPAQCGAQDTRKMDVPSIEKLNDLLAKYPFIQRISVAPELEKGVEVGKVGAERGLVMIRRSKQVKTAIRF